MKEIVFLHYFSVQLDVKGMKKGKSGDNCP